ncbi:SMI1/KNR4 family protein [Burkholderia sp. MSMB1072]|uniref:SMI1/KNR4 family protein n=1 Tax=Burkholderia sp. MSMB1072 TaxID=1637871 RepID=UPI0009E71C0A|nr:SMI1/KNR4 family protein [Burkholderia sp. MSMB1072]
MLDKLSQLGATPIDAPENRKAQLLATVESEVGPLPDDYRKMLLYFGGDIEFKSFIKFRSDEPSPWAAKDGTDSVEMLYGLSSKYGSSILEMFDTYKGRIPADWIPIGEAPGGNQVCLKVRPSGGDQSIGFWDHESEVGPGLPPSSDGLTIITNSLQDFINRLTPEDPPDAPRAVKVDLQF